MKKNEKFYQIINSTVEINGELINKSMIVYYNEIGLEELRENFNENSVIREGYVPIYLTISVPLIYESLSDEIKKLYLLTINDDSLLTEDGDLNINGKEVLKNKIRILYSQKISQIEGMQETIERYVLDGTTIPQEMIDKREILKLEYHNIISYLGI